MKLILSSLLVLLSCVSLLQGQSAEESPKLGLVLSGGGSKGIAQVGVLSVLEQEGIRPDFITGTSIGSILGGLYAIGYSVEDLERLAIETDWFYYFDDELERGFYPVYERNSAERYQIRFQLEEGKISLPTGVVRGKKIALLLSRLTIPAHGITNFDDFDIPYRGIATDFETGEAIVFDRGDLADVMRASMSIPSVFVPCEIGEQIFIDGGVTRNLPVEDAINMGADKIIAIDIGAPLYKKENLTSILDVLDQTSSFRIVESNKKQAALADVVIQPQINDISALTFDQNDTLMRRGKEATYRSLDEVKALLGNRKELSPRGVSIPEKIELGDYEIQGCNEKQLKTVRNLLQIQVCKTYTLDEIENRIKELYGSELAALVSYRLLPLEDEEGYKLIIKVVTQKGDFVRLSANYDSRLKAGLLFNLTLRNRLFSGSKFNIDFKLSENPSLGVNYHVLTATRPNIGWHLGGRMNFYPGLTYIDDKKGDLFDLRHFSTEANVFSSFNNRFLVSTGVGLERYSRSETFFDFEKNEVRLDQAFVQLRFLRDDFNHEHFPTGGSYIDLQGKYAFSRSLETPAVDSTAKASVENTMLRLRAVKVFSFWERLTPSLALDAGFIRDAENNYLHQFYLGRALTNEMTHVEFAGLRYMELPVSSYVSGQIRWQFEVFPDIYSSLIFNSAYYTTKNLEIADGQVTDKAIFEKDYLYGVGLELGISTRLGPARFSAEYNIEEHLANFYLHLGHEF